MFEVLSDTADAPRTHDRVATESYPQVQEQRASLREAQKQQQTILENKARLKIIEALVINREVKRALRKRMLEQTAMATLVIAKFLRRLRLKRELRRKRQMGVFDATIYLIRENH